MQTQTVVSGPVVRRPRIATPARWQAALRRALDNNVKLYQVSGTGAHVALSASKVGVAYQTDGVSCECEAWLHGDPVCQHRALYWFAMGVLEIDEPEAIAPATARCRDCHGDGFVRVQTGDRLSDWVGVGCPACDGRGHVPTRSGVAPPNVVPFPTTDRPRPAA